MTVNGFNIGCTLSLKDIDLAIDFLENKESFEPDLEQIKEKITSKEIGKRKTETLKEGG